MKAPLGPAEIRHSHPSSLSVLARGQDRRARARCPGGRGQEHHPERALLPGHFPDYPVCPGVLIIEAMAQVGAVGVMAGGEHMDKLALFAGIDGVRFQAGAPRRVF